MKWILVLFSVITMKTCDSSSVQKQSMVLNDTFSITTLNGKDISEFKLTITFKDSSKQVSGFSGCNRFFGSYEMKNNKLLLGPLGSTRMMCPPKFNDVESSMLDALSKVNSVSIEDDILNLSEGNMVLIKAKKQDLSTSVSFEYTEKSRRRFMSLKVNKKEILYQNTFEGAVTRLKCPDDDWLDIINALKNVDLEKIPNLEAPSQKRFFDGAAIAKLKVTLNGATYETPSFDHDHPHSYIANLVKEILSIAQNIE